MLKCEVCLERKDKFVSYRNCSVRMCTDCALLTVGEVAQKFLERQKRVVSSNFTPPSEQKQTFLKYLKGGV